MSNYQSLAYELAISEIGVYPKEYVLAGGPVTPRTPYQDGWNDAVMWITHSVIVLQQFLKTLPEEIFPFFIQGNLMVERNSENIHIMINCNDVFYLACGDSEELPVEDIPKFLEYTKKTPNGDLLYVTEKRNILPHNRTFDRFTEEDKALFRSVIKQGVLQ